MALSTDFYMILVLQ